MKAKQCSKKEGDYSPSVEELTVAVVFCFTKTEGQNGGRCISNTVFGDVKLRVVYVCDNNKDIDNNGWIVELGCSRLAPGDKYDIDQTIDNNDFLNKNSTYPCSIDTMDKWLHSVLNKKQPSGFQCVHLVLLYKNILGETFHSVQPIKTNLASKKLIIEPQKVAAKGDYK